MCSECEYPGQLGRQEPDEYETAPGIPLARLAVLGGLTQAETDRLVFGGKPPRPESAVFSGRLLRPCAQCDEDADEQCASCDRWLCGDCRRSGPSGDLFCNSGEGCSPKPFE